ncbi:MAG: DUF6262 family protein [Nostoc sp. DedQUE12b]|uniref:DUF6262 family protein n=1 Tax=Nostoc sp. DedQUE12b TaxID=3075398 RepID=UPI002AD56CB7|nr:DUF6262 family protein [Nostoc sp. DedQUE12b]MDZ8088486.1 DUF6262 family protein [Nostoc sp. DedQUE12b]
MTVERNIDGLRGNAQRKRQEAFEKVEQGIQKLIKEQRVINFNTVAKASGLSKAWLYKEPEIKARIEHLRENNSKIKGIPPKQRSSDASKDAIIKTLKERIKRVEAENRGLRDQHEAIYGRILQASEIEQRLERLEAENARLKKELDECLSRSPKPSASKKSNVPSLSNKKMQDGISNTIKDELDALGIELNTTLAPTIKNAEEEVVLTAIEALKEQLQHKAIPKPGGWLNKAIEGAWRPNQPLGEDNQPADLFSQWYGLAREFGIVIGNRKEDDGSIWVQENTGHWFSFEEFSSKWTLQYLRSKIVR